MLMWKVTVNYCAFDIGILHSGQLIYFKKIFTATPYIFLCIHKIELKWYGVLLSALYAQQNSELL